MSQLQGAQAAAACSWCTGSVAHSHLHTTFVYAKQGPSGSGKTTLLDLLAGRKTTGRTKGDILFAGNKPTRPFLRRYTGYVEQFDTLLPILTVEEMLMYTAELKRKRSEGTAQKRAAVEVSCHSQFKNAMRQLAPVPAHPCLPARCLPATQLPQQEHEQQQLNSNFFACPPLAGASGQAGAHQLPRRQDRYVD